MVDDPAGDQDEDVSVLEILALLAIGAAGVALFRHYNQSPPVVLEKKWDPDKEAAAGVPIPGRLPPTVTINDTETVLVYPGDPSYPAWADGVNPVYVVKRKIG